MGRGEGFEVSGHGCAYQEVAEEDHDCDFADRGDVDGGVFFDLWCEVLFVLGGGLSVFPGCFSFMSLFCRGGWTHLFARKVDAHGTVSDLLDGDLELVAGDTADDDVADGEAVVHGHIGLLFNNVLLVAQALASAESLHASNVDRVDLSTIVCQQSSQRSSNNLTSVDDRDPSTPKSLSVIQDGVVDVEVLEDLDHGQRSAWQD